MKNNKFSKKQIEIMDYFDDITNNHPKISEKFLNDNSFKNLPEIFDNLNSKQWAAMNKFKKENPIL